MNRDLAQYIAEQLKEIHPFFRWKVINHSKKRIVELYLTFRVEITEDIHVQDIRGEINGEKYIQFEDVIAFYDSVISDIQNENYLATINFDHELGIEKGRVQATLKHLIRVASNGKTELDEFLADSTINTFELRWGERNLQQAIQTMKEAERFDDERLFMHFEVEPSLINKFTGGNTVDGVERI